MAARKQPAYLFYGEISKGHTFKTTVDLLTASLQKTQFTVTQDGLFHRNVDNQKLSRLLLDVSFSREKFKTFRCPSPFSFFVNLKHLKTNVRTVKKKDVLTLYILSEDIKRLHIHIKPAKSNKKKEEKVHDEVKKLSKKSKTTMIDHCDITVDLNFKLMNLPDFVTDSEDNYVLDKNGEKIPVYGYPKVIDSSEFLKIKKMVTTSKILNIEMRGHDYISFYSSASGLYGSQVTIGNSSDDEEAEEEETSIYEASFHMALIHPLMKLPALSPHMQFFAPKIPNMPLKVKVDTGTIAVTTIYVKDVKSIELEEQITENNQ